ncbi:MAG: nucleotidyltransferase domain-containing protein [Gallionella sp.]
MKNSDILPGEIQKKRWRSCRVSSPKRKRWKLILRAHVPHAEVWAYGSRVTGSDHEASDLDLVLRNPQNLQEETSSLYNLKEAFTESNLPIRVDVMDWARIPTSFHREIERAQVVCK